MNDNTAVIEVQPRSITENFMKMTEINQIDKLIDELVTQKFVNGVHFGKIPGVPKECLFQPGAQLFNAMFRVFPRFETETIQLHDHKDHINVISTCSLYTTKGVTIGTGQGSCSSMESKYRYRSDFISTGKPVPQAYWKSKDINLIGGKGYAVKKVDNDGKVTEEKSGKWCICEATGKIENPDIADQWNTILKMANKRAYIAATQSAWALSGRYTQDVEDMQDNTKASNNPPKASTKKKAAPPPQDKTQQELDYEFVIAMDKSFDTCNASLNEMGFSPFKDKDEYGKEIKEYVQKIKNRPIDQKAIGTATNNPQQIIDMFVASLKDFPPPSD